MLNFLKCRGVADPDKTRRQRSPDASVLPVSSTVSPALFSNQYPSTPEKETKSLRVSGRWPLRQPLITAVPGNTESAEAAVPAALAASAALSAAADLAIFTDMGGAMGCFEHGGPEDGRQPQVLSGQQLPCSDSENLKSDLVWLHDSPNNRRLGLMAQAATTVKEEQLQGT
jgi:hypothetical protein